MNGQYFGKRGYLVQSVSEQEEEEEEQKRKSVRCDQN